MESMNETKYPTNYIMYSPLSNQSYNLYTYLELIFQPWLHNLEVVLHTKKIALLMQGPICDLKRGR